MSLQTFEGILKVDNSRSCGNIRAPPWIVGTAKRRRRFAAIFEELVIRALKAVAKGRIFTGVSIDLSGA